MPLITLNSIPCEQSGYHVPMRLILLTARPELRANRRLAEAAESLGADCTLLDATQLVAIVKGEITRPIGSDQLRPAPTAVIARVGNWRPASVLAVLESMVAEGVSTPNPPSAIRIGRDHWRTIRILAEAALPVPATIAGADPEILAREAECHLGVPVVVKQRRSRMGIGAILCTTQDHLEAVLDSLWRLGDEVVVQRWLPRGTTTLRVLVVRGCAVAAARFTAGKGEWRSNAARGGWAEAHNLEAEEAAVATAAAGAVGLGQCGVDLILEDGGPVVIEVNPTPGFLRLEEATGTDVARLLVADALNKFFRGG